MCHPVVAGTNLLTLIRSICFKAFRSEAKEEDEEEFEEEAFEKELELEDAAAFGL